MKDPGGLADETIVRKVLGGDTEAYGLLVERYSAKLMGYAYCLSHDYDVAADLTQETLIAAYDTLDCLEEPRKFAAWAAGIMRNKFRNLGRSNPVRTLSLDQMVAKGFDPPDPASDASAVQSETDTSDAALDAVRRCVEALPDKYRESLTLRYAGDLSYREIARFLGLKETTVTMRLTYARRLLLKRAKEIGLL
ncbi:RNA polymerase sigma factor [Candidatus Sumerlaeota bacterium]|nr:RNA polymerase sigma factor [Candidatus Sumerlaeota bacterium]